ncbi:MAG: recQ, partial [uncultured bacterium]
MKTKIYEYLKKYFGYDEFRPGQYDIIENIVSGNSALAIMPTGGGKSLCYQIPALIFEGITIVVSPLISLMKDQVDKLKERNIPVALINSTLSNSEVLETINEVRNNRIKILYVAPERFNSKLFFDDLNGVKVSFFAVDEAHCISQWGHDFRPSYLRLRRAVEHLGNPVVAGFTATATHEVRLDIIKNLGMFNPKVVIRGFDRPNIKYLTLLLKENEKKEELVRVINKFRVTTIVYCSTKKTTLLVADYLNKHKITCGVYHGSMDGDA